MDEYKIIQLLACLECLIHSHVLCHTPPNLPFLSDEHSLVVVDARHPLGIVTVTTIS